MTVQISGTPHKGVDPTDPKIAPQFDHFIGLSVDRVSVRGLHAFSGKGGLLDRPRQYNENGTVMGIAAYMQASARDAADPSYSGEIHAVVGHRHNGVTLLGGVDGRMFFGGNLGRWGWSRAYSVQADVAVNKSLSGGALLRINKTFLGRLGGEPINNTAITSPVPLGPSNMGAIDSGQVRRTENKVISPYINFETGNLRTYLEYSLQSPEDWTFGKIRYQSVRLNQDIAIDKNKKLVVTATAEQISTQFKVSEPSRNYVITAGDGYGTMRYENGGDAIAVRYSNSVLERIGVGVRWKPSEDVTVHASCARQRTRFKDDDIKQLPNNQINVGVSFQF